MNDDDDLYTEFRTECVQVLYVVKSGPELPIKIGVTSNLEKRLEQLQVGNWNKLEAHWYSFVGREKGRTRRNFYNSLSRGALALERKVMRKMTELDLWVAGEWFDCDPDVAVSIIAKVAKMEGYEFFGAEVLESVKLYEKMPISHLQVVESMIRAEESARKVLGLTKESA